MCSFLLRKNVYIYKETGVLGETNLDIKILQVCYEINNDDYFKKKPLLFEYTGKCDTKENERSMRIKWFYSPTTPPPPPICA